MIKLAGIDIIVIFIIYIIKFFKSLDIIDFTNYPFTVAIKIDKNVLETKVPVINNISNDNRENNFGLPILIN